MPGGIGILADQTESLVISCSFSLDVSSGASSMIGFCCQLRCVCKSGSPLVSHVSRNVGSCPQLGQGRGLLRALRLFRFGLLELCFQGHQVALALLQAFAMPVLGGGLGHFVLLGLTASAFLSTRFGPSPETVRVALACADDAGRDDDGLATIVDIESTVVDHALEAVP